MKLFATALILALSLSFASFAAAEPQPAAPVVSAPADAPLAAFDTAQGCPFLIACRYFIDSGCECDPYFCNGQYHCARPFEPGSAAPSPFASEATPACSL
jgi:hypothetical protein